MIRLVTTFLCFGALLLAVSGRAHAWDAIGHMMVAQVAWQKLTPGMRATVSALLRRNPDYDAWIRNVPGHRRDEFAFMSASVWPDDIKSDDVRYTDENDTPNGPRAARNVGYQDVLRHRYWHYVNFPFSPDGSTLEPPDAVNLQTQIHALRETLKSPASSQRLKSYDLVWLMHLVGDAHQPLHATSRFTMALPRGDRGGGAIIVCPSACGPKNPSLHSFWDGVVSQGMTTRAQARAAALALASADEAAAAIPDEQTWLSESFALARTAAYAAPIGTGAGPFTLTATYEANARRTAQERIALAGARLAALIEHSL